MEKSEKGKLLVGKRGFLFLEEFDLSSSTVDFGIMTEGGRRRKRKWRETTNCLAQGWMRLFSPPPPPSLGNRSAFSFTPLASRQRHWRESVPPPPLFIPFSPPPSQPSAAFGPLSSPPRFFPSGYWTTLAFGGSGQGPMMRSGIEYRLAL